MLLVDDEEDVLTVYRHLLERRIPGARVLTADSGPAGLELLDQHPIRVIVSDYRMPGMNGIAFLAEAHRRHPSTYRILFTAFADANLSRQAAEEAIVHAFLSKDVPPERLVDVVRSFLTA